MTSLFDGYRASKESRALPNIVGDYVARISDRLASVAREDGRFASRPIHVNNDAFEPWQAYVDLLNRNREFLSAITPPFSTVVHGDPNPGNVMLRTNVQAIDVKLIDPKEWLTGDYLFDIAKLTHFIEGTGPIEKPASGVPMEITHRDIGAFAELNYQLDQPRWTNGIVAACLDRVRQFAEANSDMHWPARYELAMASNLLGLPAGRLEKGRLHAALALYGEGLRWLKKFCIRLPNSPAVTKRPLAIAQTSAVEPTQLAEARTRVRADAPQVVDAIDKRGFKALHWNPARSNAAGKPAELSLEHEARLTANSDRALETFKDRLAASLTMTASNALLPDHAQFGRLTVKRVPRDTGAQSIDRYWDLIDASVETRLIPRMMSLRERAKTSTFMTWGTTADERALNLELPFVAYAQSGVIARLEFNWIDNLSLTIAEFAAGASGQTDNPLILAARIEGIGEGGFKQVLEHTTFREKYLVRDGGQEVLQLNVDHVVAQSLRTRRLASYTDIDIAPSKIVDSDVLASLIAFSQALGERYSLAPVAATKVWRDASLTGEL